MFEQGRCHIILEVICLWIRIWEFIERFFSNMTRYGIFTISLISLEKLIINYVYDNFIRDVFLDKEVPITH